MPNWRPLIFTGGDRTRGENGLGTLLRGIFGFLSDLGLRVLVSRQNWEYVLINMKALGVDIGGSSIRVGVVDDNGHLLQSATVPTPQDSTEQFLLALQKIVGQLWEPSLSGIGIGWPGAVDTASGVVLETPNLRMFRHFPLKQQLESHLRVECLVDNDAKCAGLAERDFGAGRGFQDFIFLTFGTGIGGAIFANSQLVRGQSGLAGEIGHLCLHPGGLPCGCGGLGCFEQYCSARALEKRVNERLQKNLTAKEILILSQSQIGIQQVLGEYADDLAVALGSLLNIFDPEALVFAGGLFTSGGSPILDELRKRRGRQGFQSVKKNTVLLASELQGQAGLIGAANLVLSRHTTPSKRNL